MIQSFSHKEIVVAVKTTMLKGDTLYFGERDVQELIAVAYNNVTYARGHGISYVRLIIEVYKELVKMGLKPDSISAGNIKYTGVRMNDVNTQQVLEK
jgi:hypothetical protein